MIELILPIIGLMIVVDVFRCIEKYSEIRFKNEILDLDVNNKYSLNDIKTIFLNICDFNSNIDELSEYNIKRIHRLLNQVKGNLLKKETTYYNFSFIFGIS